MYLDLLTLKTALFKPLKNQMLDAFNGVLTKLHKKEL